MKLYETKEELNNRFDIFRTVNTIEELAFNTNSDVPFDYLSAEDGDVISIEIRDMKTHQTYALTIELENEEKIYEMVMAQIEEILTEEMQNA